MWIDVSALGATNPFMYVFGDDTAGSFRAFANGAAAAAGTSSFVAFSLMSSFQAAPRALDPPVVHLGLRRHRPGNQRVPGRRPGEYGRAESAQHYRDGELPGSVASPPPPGHCRLAPSWTSSACTTGPLLPKKSLTPGTSRLARIALRSRLPTLRQSRRRWSANRRDRSPNRSRTGSFGDSNDVESDDRAAGPERPHTMTEIVVAVRGQDPLAQPVPVALARIGGAA